MCPSSPALSDVGKLVQSVETRYTQNDFTAKLDNVKLPLKKIGKMHQTKTKNRKQTSFNVFVLADCYSSTYITLLKSINAVDDENMSFQWNPDDN